MDLPETILEQVHLFPFPIQELIIGEAHEMSRRIEKGKAPPDKTQPECNCLCRESGLGWSRVIFRDWGYEGGGNKEQGREERFSGDELDLFKLPDED